MKNILKFAAEAAVDIVNKSQTFRVNQNGALVFDGETLRIPVRISYRDIEVDPLCDLLSPTPEIFGFVVLEETAEPYIDGADFGSLGAQRRAWDQKNA